jgi:acetyl-CoA carboxylase biotin carboxyl carrier protein
MDLTNEDVADILALLDSLPYDELDLRTPRFRLTLRRAPGGGWTEETQVLTPATAVAPASNGTDVTAPETAGGVGADTGAHTVAGTGAHTVAGTGAQTVAGTGEARAGLVAVPAPLPGTFYRAPRPGAPSFVEVGDEVGEDTVVAIVETMKLMNSVHAGTRGRVAEICLANAEPTAQGATLMWITPALAR